MCLTINSCQSVKYEKGEIKFLNYGNQIPIVFKIYADSECSFKKVEIWEGEYTRKYQKDIPNSFCAKLVCIDDRLSLPEVIFRGNNSCNDFIKWILQTQKWCNEIIKEHFNKLLVMSNYDEKLYNNSDKCWICIKI